VRNNSYPHLGSRVLDGTKSDHDWLDIVDFKDLPFVINPEKGYISNSNNRIVPENSKHDIGAGVTNSIRNLRIDEIID
jgi:penicillin amidase